MMSTPGARSLLALLAALAILAGCADLQPPGGPEAPGPSPSEPQAPASEGPVSQGSDPAPAEPGIDDFEVRSLDGSGNNPDDPDLGRAGGNYRRVAPASYGEGGVPVELPADPRYISNRVYNDTHQNLFSARGVTQWTWLWGQFIDHTIGLRDGEGEDTNLAFDGADPLEEFTTESGEMPFRRSALVAGDEGAFDQANLVSSYIDGFSVYGGSEERLEWLRDGPVDGDLSNNAATMLVTDEGYLPTAAARSDVEAPSMELSGRLANSPPDAVIAGDRRANENIALTATQTLFVREHNRIVAALPDDLGEQRKFDIARRVVGAEIQYITYNEFLPAIGVELPAYRGYDPDVDPSLSNEFATVGYRAHSMIHGEIEMEVAPDRYSAEQLAAFADLGIEVAEEEDATEVAIPLHAGFVAPGLVPAIGLGPLLDAMGGEPQYRNDEQFDNQLRSVLFLDPDTGIEDWEACVDGPTMADCFNEDVVDLAAIDMMRALDHGIPAYNDLREAYGLARQTSFTDVTGEDTDEFPDDPEIDAEDPIDDPDILDFVELRDADGEIIPIDEAETLAEEGVLAVEGTRRASLAARLRAIYGDVDALDPFTGMVSEAHVPGTEFGELQLAIWTEEFTSLRDGDRFFYAGDPVLDEIEAQYGIGFERTLAQVILDNTDLTPDQVQDNVFFSVEE
ncbi:MAG TPA: peroxidase family protein [Euzebyales bacterium]|nr:peroxidase family protein [Euzebyales bacterium]